MAKKPVTPKKPEATNGESKKPKKEKRARVRMADPNNPDCWVRAFVDVIEKYGAPMTPDGKRKMVPTAARRGITDEERARRKAEKEAEKQRIQNMSEEERLAYAKAKREERATKRAAKKAAERAALIEQIKKEIAEGKL